MDAKELRIDNWVLIHGFYDKVILIDDTLNLGPFIETDNHKDEIDFKNIKPIPLTEEWLIKFNLKIKSRVQGWAMYELFSTGEITYWAKCWRGVKDQKGLCSIDLEVRDVDGKSIAWVDEVIDLEFVHELQNFVYNHTKTELQINNQ